MTADLPADVRASAAKALELARQLYDNAALYPNASDRTRAMVTAVTAVVAPEIERPLQARIAELKTENLHLGLELEARDDAQWDLHQRLLPELAEAKEENQRLHEIVHRERPSVGDMVVEPASAPRRAGRAPGPGRGAVSDDRRLNQDLPRGSGPGPAAHRRADPTSRRDCPGRCS